MKKRTKFGSDMLRLDLPIKNEEEVVPAPDEFPATKCGFCEDGIFVYRVKGGITKDVCPYCNGTGLA